LIYGTGDLKKGVFSEKTPRQNALKLSDQI
jgi:hypothetical protein